MTLHVDYSLHGLVGIRVVDATPSDAAVVTRQLGPIQSPLEQEPDIFIRFVDQLPISSPVRYLDLDDVGYTDDAFLMLRSKYKSHVKVRIPFHEIGKQCEIVCERGLPAVPLLIHIINMTALAKGILPLHAAAFNYRDTGVLVTGWTKGGKTETLLAFMANGAEYVGDEWVYLSRDGKRLFGIPEPIRIWSWHLDYLPQYWTLLGRGRRAKLSLLKQWIDGVNRVASKGARGSAFPFKIMNQMTPLLKKRMCVDWPPEKLFGKASCSLVGSPDKLFFVASHDASDVTIKPTDPQEIARRMVFSLQQEQMKFVSYYRKFRFAFPEMTNELIEQSETLQRKRLTRAFSDKEAYAIYHPYPVPIQALFDTIRPYCN